jgi:hypothetical protein
MKQVAVSRPDDGPTESVEKVTKTVRADLSLCMSIVLISKGRGPGSVTSDDRFTFI